MKPRRKTGSAPKRKAATRTALPRKAAKSKTAARKPSRAASGKAASTQGSRAVVANIAADCTIPHAAELRASLARIVGKPSVTLDLTSVRRIDTAGVQVLAAFILERRAAGHPVRFQGATAEFVNTVKLLGLGALFSPVMDDGIGATVGNA